MQKTAMYNTLNNSWIATKGYLETVFEAIEQNPLAAHRVYTQYSGYPTFSPEGFTALSKNGGFEDFLCFLNLKLEKEKGESIKKHFETYHGSESVMRNLPDFYVRQINRFFFEHASAMLAE